MTPCIASLLVGHFLAPAMTPSRAHPDDRGSGPADGTDTPPPQRSRGDVGPRIEPRPPPESGQDN